MCARHGVRLLARRGSWEDLEDRLLSLCEYSEGAFVFV